MNVLFLSISYLPDLSGHGISADLLHEFRRKGHEVFVVCAQKDGNSGHTTEIEYENGCRIVRVPIGKNKKASLIRKGITTVCLPIKYKKAIGKFYKNIRFNLVLYPTPPVTVSEVVKYVKRRDDAETYLLLKDIFPQNAVDLGMMRTTGLKGVVYRYFRNKEKKLYAVSDRIGCMSQANVDYVLKHNPEIIPEKVEVCPNSVEVQDIHLSDDEKIEIRKKYGIPTEKKVFIYGGNLGKPQGVPFLIECLRTEKENGQAFFLIVGDGTEYGKLESFYNEEKPENVRLVRRLPKEDYDRLVAACDVGLIFLDHRFTIPNFPSRLLAYLQAGVPVLACTDPNSDICTVITDGGFGWWCESDGVSSFKKIISDINIMKYNLSNMGKQGRRFLLDNYTAENSYQIIMKNR